MAATQSQSSNNNNNNNNNSVPSSATFSFKAPLCSAASRSRSRPPRGSSPRGTSATTQACPTPMRGGRARCIDTARDDGESGGGEDGEQEGRDADEGGEGVVVGKESGVKEKKVRRKWTPAETQMLVDGCTKHSVGNWKAILSDPALTFAGRSPVDLKDRVAQTDARRTHTARVVFESDSLDARAMDAWALCLACDARLWAVKRVLGKQTKMLPNAKDDEQNASQAKPNPKNGYTN
ncbi:hypothetical protein C8F04DRAFT_1279585 [Mycena alexandri]|uniref:Myb-like domain-containing protein n=1 Tax=Mycena alexandri TaxID=1745969 RepID=A0AAD6RZB2_9AGAR|nr:hypothetical protein C8F04DRAFT_1279585 [Mycena alexandri]